MQCFATGCINCVADSRTVVYADICISIWACSVSCRTAVTARLARVRKEYVSRLAAAGGDYRAVMDEWNADIFRNTMTDELHMLTKN